MWQLAFELLFDRDHIFNLCILRHIPVLYIVLWLKLRTLFLAIRKMVNLLLLGVFSNVPEYLLRGLTKTLTCTKNKALSSIFPKMNGWSLLSTPLPSWVPHRSAVLRGILLEALWCTAAPPPGQGGRQGGAVPAGDAAALHRPQGPRHGGGGQEGVACSAARLMGGDHPAASQKKEHFLAGIPIVSAPTAGAIFATLVLVPVGCITGCLRPA